MGDFVFAKNGYLRCPQDPTLAEALACREVLFWIKVNNHHDIVLETDFQVLHLAILNPSPDMSNFGSIVRDCILYVKIMQNVTLQFSRRSANHTTHLLAKAVGFQTGPREWVHVPPQFICNSFKK